MLKAQCCKQNHLTDFDQSAHSCLKLLNLQYKNMEMESDAEKLILLVKNRPTIYNCKLKEYSNRNAVDKLWLEISKEMQCDMTVCKNKWTTLRNSYSRALRNQKTVKTGAMGIPIKRWYLQDAMDFMRNYMRLERNKRRRDSTSSENSFTISNTVTEYEETNDESFQHSSPLNETPSETHMTVLKWQKSMTPVEEVAAPMMTQFNISHIRENESPNILFFRSLLPDLDKLSPKRQRAFKSLAFQKLMELLDAEEYEYEGTS